MSDRAWTLFLISLVAYLVARWAERWAERAGERDD